MLKIGRKGKIQSFSISLEGKEKGLMKKFYQLLKKYPIILQVLS